jgi:hypothetical protein
VRLPLTTTVSSIDPEYYDLEISREGLPATLVLTLAIA